MRKFWNEIYCPWHISSTLDNKITDDTYAILHMASCPVRTSALRCQQCSDTTSHCVRHSSRVSPTAQWQHALTLESFGRTHCHKISYRGLKSRNDIHVCIWFILIEWHIVQTGSIKHNTKMHKNCKNGCLKTPSKCWFFYPRPQFCFFK